MDLERILFRDWRYLNDDENQPKKDFPLNDPKYKGRDPGCRKEFWLWFFERTCGLGDQGLWI